MQFDRIKKISFLFVGGLLLAQFGGSACQDQPIQFPAESAGGGQSFSSPLTPNNEENHEPIEAGPEKSVKTAGPEGIGQATISNLADDETVILRSYTYIDKGSHLGETTTEVNDIVYDLSDPMNPKVTRFEARRGSEINLIHDIQYDNSNRTIGYECKDELRNVSTEIFDMVYDHDGLLRDYKVKTIGADGAFHVTSMQGSAYHRLDAEFIIVPDLKGKAGDWFWEKIIKPFLEEEEERQKVEDALEAQEEADRKTPLERAFERYEQALIDLKRIQELLAEAQTLFNALSADPSMNGTKALEEANSMVKARQDLLKKAEQEFKEAWANLKAERVKEALKK